MSRRLINVADIYYGKSPKDVLDEDGVVPVMGTGGLYGRAREGLFTGPAIVVPRKGSLGKPQYVDGPFWPVDTTYAVLPKRGVDARWLYYSLDLFDLTKLNEATGVPSISRDWLCKVPVSSAESGQQQRIAEVLSTIDEAIEQTETLIAKTQQIKSGLMHDLFTRGVTPDGELRPPRSKDPQSYKESPLGWIPKEWDARPLNQLAELNRGKFSIRPRNDPRYYGGRFPFIQTGDVALATGRVLTDFTQTLNTLGVSVSRMFPQGTIMVTIAANIADTCILGIPMCAPDSLVGVVPNKNEVTRYLELCIRRRKRWFENRASQTAQKNINLEDLRPLGIPYPEKHEQAFIAERYEAIDATLIEQERIALKIAEIKRGLMRDLLTGRVRMKTTEPQEVVANV